MAIFGKRKHATPDPTDLEAPVVPQGEPGVDRDWERSVDGPFDIAERPELGLRLDLGTLRVPAQGGMELRLDVEQGSSRMVGATCVLGPDKVQLQAFAAPRSAGIWNEIRLALIEGIVKSGGSAETVQGLFGPELQTRMPGRAADGRVVYQPARFLGVDGPRWFLRVVVNGPAATDDEAMSAVRVFIRDLVVDRGDEPRPPRELLALQPPPQVAEAAARKAGEAPTGEAP